MIDIRFDQLIIEVDDGTAWKSEDKLHPLILQCLHNDLCAFEFNDYSSLCLLF